jgi:hypothetical protein|tara:strand:- start:13053 stop:13328 length:276 start_codon:yes stop_codon:yes gene_type:complete
MKYAVRTIEYFAHMGAEARTTPYLDDREKLNLMSEYFEIILDVVDGDMTRVKDWHLKSIRGEDNEDYDEEETWLTGSGCGCGGSCLCGQES